MNTLHQDFKNLENYCFVIESKLPMFNGYNKDTDPAYIRRELYKMRIRMSELQRFADLKEIEYENSLAWKR